MNETSIYIKRDETFTWPSEEKFFYILAEGGLYLCRNHPFFSSCVKVKEGPRELVSQKEFVRLKYPKIPKTLIERVVGFFRLVADKQNSESAAIWVWNRVTNQVEVIIPEQKAYNSGSSPQSPHGWPMDVKYEMPTLTPDQVYMGDIHCHVDMSAFASGTDESDEVHRPGIHIIVGHIYTQPTFYCDAVVDGERFQVEDFNLIWEGFEKPDTASVPPEWVERVKLATYKYESSTSYTGGYTYQGYGGYSGSGGYLGAYSEKPDKKDKKIMKEILQAFLRQDKCPLMSTVRQELFHRTKHLNYLACEAKAQKFVDRWPRLKAYHEENIAETEAE